LMKAVWDRHIKYGEVIDDLGGNGLGLRPRASRLEIADPSRIREPEFQAMYI
jgi:hypothetical protein